MKKPSTNSSFSSVLEKPPHLTAALGLAVILATLTFIAYPSLDAPFLLDDVDQIHQTASQGSIGEALQPDCYGLYRPVKTLAFYSLYRAFPESPLHWHLAGLSLFCLSTLLFYFLSKRLFGKPWMALAATAIWALAPTQVSTYVWSSSINIQIMTFAVLSALLYTDILSSSRSAPKRMVLVFGIVCAYVIAFFSYESAIVLPALLLIWLHARRLKILTKDNIITFLALGATGLALLMIRQLMKGNLQIDNVQLHGFSALQLAGASGHFIWHHVMLWCWPFGQQAILGTLVNDGPYIGFLWGWLMLAGTTAAIWFARNACPLLLPGWLFFLVSFLPMSNLLPFFNGPYADYYLIVPSIGLTIVLVSVLGVLMTRMESARQQWRLILLFMLIPLLRIGAVGSAFAWSRAWNDETVLYANTLKTFPDAYTAKANLARCLSNPAALDYAEQLAREAVEAAPWYTHGRYVLVSIYLKTGRMEEAMQETEIILSESPTQLYPWSVMGYLKENLAGDRNAAIEAYGMAQRLSWQAESESATINHARLLSLDGKDAEALALLQKAQARAPGARGLRVVCAEFNRNPDLFRDAIE
jgi:hypothetical protein